jgi:hypothetical protein
MSVGIVSDSLLSFYNQFGITEAQCQWLNLMYKIHCPHGLFAVQNKFQEASLPLSGIPNLVQYQMGWAISHMHPEPNLDPALSIFTLCFNDSDKTPFNLKLLEYRVFSLFCFGKLGMKRHEDIFRIQLKYGTLDYVALSEMIIQDKYKNLKEASLMNFGQRHQLTLAIMFMERANVGYCQQLCYNASFTNQEKNPYMRMEKFNSEEFLIFKIANKFDDPDGLDQQDALWTAKRKF